MTARRFSAWAGSVVAGWALAAAVGAADCPSPCISVDVSSSLHPVSPLLFGDQIQWKNYGQDFMSVDAATPTTASLQTDLVDALKPLGLTLLRYPSGTLSDFFHWSQTTGPWAARIDQRTDDLVNGTTNQLILQRPVFGVDEFTDVAARLGTEIMITANVGDGTPAEAAAWLTYLKARGVNARYWEIGNEVYLYGNYIMDLQHKDAVTYAALYDQYAAALRAVDPTVRIGMVGIHRPGVPVLDDWNRVVFQNISQKVDFLAVHNFYAPWDYTTEESTRTYQALLAAPLGFRLDLDLIEADVAAHAAPASRDLALAITEHGALFLYPPTGLADLVTGMARNRTLASALFSALSYHVMMRDPAVQIANHINPVSHVWQAPLTLAYPNLPGAPWYDAGRPAYPVQYEPNPVPSAFYHMFRLYRDAAGGTVVAVSTAGFGAYDAPSFGQLPAVNGVPLVDAVAVRGAGRVDLFVVNRDLAQSLTAHVDFRGTGASVYRLRRARLAGFAPNAQNTSADPRAVTVVEDDLPPAVRFTDTLPACSLTRYTLETGTPVAPSDAVGYPNPFRPGAGEVLTVGRLPAAARVEIFTLAGRWVRSLAADEIGQARWDGLDEAGEAVAPGVYLVVAHGDGRIKKLKIVLQR